MAQPANLFQELRDALKDFRDFLASPVVTAVKQAIQALAALIPQINQLVDKLIELMGKLKTEIDKLDVANIPGLDKVSEFTGKITTLLTTTKNLLPAQAGAIDDVLAVASVVTSLPSLEDIKTEIKDLITEITTQLQSLKA
jgi:hypothetical protein